MTKSLTKFFANVDSASILERIFEYLSKKTMPFEQSELLRAEFVMLVSAFDCYVHDFVRERMVFLFSNPIEMNDKVKDYKVSLGTMVGIMNEANPIVQMQLFESEIKKIETKNSYQSSYSVENVLGIVGFKKIWTTIWRKKGEASVKKQQLNLIVRRRNQIAHEADMDYVTNKKNVIALKDVRDAREFLTDLAVKIDSLT